MSRYGDNRFQRVRSHCFYPYSVKARYCSSREILACTTHRCMHGGCGLRLAVWISVKLSGREIRFSGLFSVSGPHRKIICRHCSSDNQSCSSVFRHCSSSFPGFSRFRSNPENSFPPESLTLVFTQGRHYYIVLAWCTCAMHQGKPCFS